jgi:hypothetical protein
MDEMVEEERKGYAKTLAGVKKLMQEKPQFNQILKFLEDSNNELGNLRA